MKMCGSAWGVGERREGREEGGRGGREGKQRKGTSSCPGLALLLATSAHQVFFHLPPQGEQGLGPGPLCNLCVIPTLGPWTLPHESLHCSIRLPELSKMPTRSCFWLEFDSGSERNCLRGLPALGTEAGAAGREGNGMGQGNGRFGDSQDNCPFQGVRGDSNETQKDD